MKSHIQTIKQRVFSVENPSSPPFLQVLTFSCHFPLSLRRWAQLLQNTILATSQSLDCTFWLRPEISTASLNSGGLNVLEYFFLCLLDDFQDFLWAGVP